MQGVRTATVADVSSASGSLRHTTRAFDGLPDANEANRLLSEIAGRTCSFGPVLVDGPVALYGAGNLGRMAYELLRCVGQNVSFIVDRAAARVGTDPAWSGTPVLHPRDLADRAPLDVCIAVSIATIPYVPIEHTLSGFGFRHVVPFYDLAESFRHLHPLSNGWFAPPLNGQDLTNTDLVLRRWHDDVSRAHHLQFLAWRRLREEWLFESAAVHTGNRYFVPEITGVLHDNEIYLDGGAYHGSAVQAFVRHSKRYFQHVIAIEPDPHSRAALEKNLRSDLAGAPHTVLDCALADREGDAMFRDGLGYASQVSDTGKMRVRLRRLDDLGFVPSFIKLHLEGGELCALQGGVQTLQSARPIVVATVYHNADGIWRTPLWLMDNLSDYRFLFRLHAWCGTGAVIYAIPQERYRS